jgi:predicted AAA+ superfamily ATPase
MQYEEKTLFEYLLSVYVSIILKDIVQHQRIQNVSFFQDLYRYTMTNIGNIISAKSIRDYLTAQRLTISTDTVINFLHYGTETFLLNKVKSVHPNTKQYFEIFNKYYAGDLGLRNAIVGYGFDKDMRKLMENYVFLELKRNGYEVKIGRLANEKEIDFIAEKQGIIKYFQVCYLLDTQETIDREYGVFAEINDNWEKYVVSFDERDMGIKEGIKRVSVMELSKVL